jgi:hypothetical protein
MRTNQLGGAILCAVVFSMSGILWGDCATATVTSNTPGRLVSTDSALACIVRNLYGPNGLVLANPAHSQDYKFIEGEVNDGFNALNSQIATQFASPPLASPASGFTFTFDRATGIYTRSTQTLGPILSERSETVGQGRVYVGFTFQRYDFDGLDGLNLHSIPVVFQTGGGLLSDESRKDVITTRDDLDLKISQSTIFATVGLTNRIDLSVVVPVVSAEFTATSVATVFRVAAPNPFAPGADPVTGQFHYFDSSDPNGSTQKTFVNSGSARGLGDVIFRGKANVWRGQSSGLAFGLDVRVPTGDARNFLGSGALGVKPFVAASTGFGRVSPHVNFGYEWNGRSVLAGESDFGTFAPLTQKEKLPDQLFWTGGADVAVQKHVTVVLDVVGTRVLNGEQIELATFTTQAGQLAPATNLPDLGLFGRDSFNTVSGSAGVKFGFGDRFLATFNLLFRVNNSGLRENAAPLIGVSYAF